MNGGKVEKIGHDDDFDAYIGERSSGSTVRVARDGSDSVRAITVDKIADCLEFSLTLINE